MALISKRRKPESSRKSKNVKTIQNTRTENKRELESIDLTIGNINDDNQRLSETREELLDKSKTGFWRWDNSDVLEKSAKDIKEQIDDNDSEIAQLKLDRQTIAKRL